MAIYLNSKPTYSNASPFPPSSSNVDVGNQVPSAQYLRQHYGEDELLLWFNDEYRKHGPSSSNVYLGEWNGNLNLCKQYAEQYGIPMVAVWSNKACAHCNMLLRGVTDKTFTDWAQTCNLILCYTCSYDPLGTRNTGEYYKFCQKPDNPNLFPFVRLYWYKDGKKIIDKSVTGDDLDKQSGISSWTDENGLRHRDFKKAADNTIQYLEKCFSSYVFSGFDITSQNSDVITLHFDANGGMGLIDAITIKINDQVVSNSSFKDLIGELSDKITDTSKYDLVDSSQDPKICTGAWYGNVVKCKQIADERGIPCVLIATSSGCEFCSMFTSDVLVKPEFKKWMSESEYLFCMCKVSMGNWTGTQGNAISNWLTMGDLPRIAWYWKKDGKVIVDAKETAMPARGKNYQWYIDKTKQYFGK